MPDLDLTHLPVPEEPQTVNGEPFDWSGLPVDTPDVVAPAVMGASQTDPESFAKSRDLAQRSGLPLFLVERNREEVERKQRQKDDTALIVAHPELTRHYARPEFAALAKDDVGVLEQVVRTLKDPLPALKVGVGQLGQGIAAAPRAMASFLGHQIGGALGMAAGATEGIEGIRRGGEVGAEIGRGVGQGLTEDLGQPLQKGSEALIRSALQDAPAAARMSFEEARAAGLTTSWVAFQSIANSPQLVGMIAGLFVPAVRAPYLALMGETSAGQQYAQAIADGADPTAATFDAMLNGAAEILGENLPFTGFDKIADFLRTLGPQKGLKWLGQVTGVLGSMMGIESVEEMATQFLQNASAKFTGTQPEQKLGEGVLAAGLVAAPLGLLGGAGAVLALPTGFEEDANRANAADGEAVRLDHQVALVTQTKLATLAPDELKVFLDDVVHAEDAVHLDAQDAATFFQSHPEVLTTLQAKSPETAAGVEEAIVAGQSVAIPKADYLTYFAPYHDELRERVRSDVDRMSVKEATEWRQTQAEAFAKEAAAIEATRQEDTAFMASADQVSTAIRDQIVATGRFTPDVAEKYAALHRAVAVSLAARTGMQPHEVYQRYQLQVGGAPITGAALTQEEPDASRLRTPQGEPAQTPPQEAAQGPEGDGGQNLEQPPPGRGDGGEGAAVTETPAFRAWFGDSKVVDENGAPLVVYHGTADPTFDRFKYKGGFGGALGYWFASTGEAASAFANERFAGQGPGVFPVFLSITNPMEYRGYEEFVAHVDKLRSGRSIESGVKALRRGLMQRGFDGIVIRNSETDAAGVRDDWVAFRPEQIKSVNNRGTFDPTDPRILFQGAAPQPVTAESALQTALGEYQDAFPETDSIAEHNAKVEIFDILREGAIVDSNILDGIRNLGEDLESMLQYAGEKRYVSEIVAEHEDDTERDEAAFPESIWDVAKLARGTTDDLFEAGYVLPDGTLLDFSGKQYGNPGGQRTDDHRQLGFGVSQDVVYTDAMIAFMRLGAIRIDASAGFVDTEALPTSQQFRVIRHIYEQKAGWLEVRDGDRAGTLNIDNPSAVEGAIRRFYRGEDFKGTTLFQSAQASPTFLSAVHQAAAGLDLGKKGQPLAQVLATLRKQPGVKAEELATLNLEEALGGLERVTKDDLLAAIDERGVRVEVKTLGKGGTWNEYLAERGLVELPNGDIYVHRTESYAGQRLSRSGVEEDFRNDKGDLTKFADYQLPGGENYREVLLTLPGLDFESSHFPGVKGLVAHLRVNERTDSAGRNVLFVEEIQSDLHQKGRAQGYNRPGELTFREVKGGVDAYLNGERMGFWETREQATEDLRDHPNYANTIKGIPDAPFKTTWPLLAFKQALRMAVDQGADVVAWTTGAQQAERYDLSKQVDSVEIRRAEEGDLFYVAAKRDGANVVEREDVRGLDGVAELVGKDLAKKAEQIEPGGRDTFSGLDLRVGGEGMAGFYDQILPAAVNKYVKRWGGRVSESRINQQNRYTVAWIPGDQYEIRDEFGRSAPSETFDTREAAEAVARQLETGGVTVHSLEITPALREAVAQGQPLFQPGPRAQINIPAAFPEQPAVISLLENADLTSFLHESAHFWLEVIADLSQDAALADTLGADFQTLLTWFGVPDRATWQAMSVEERRAHHERFAESFEDYLLEGKAPSTGLRQLFATFRSWLVSVYRQLRGTAQLTDEVRGVFDRLLATDDEIEAASAAFAPLFALQDDAGMTAEEWARYQEVGADATVQAEEQLQTRSLKEMQWVSRATNRALKALQAQHEARRKAMRAEVAAEVYRRPVYAAQRFLKRGQVLNEAAEFVQGEGGHRLAIPALKAMYPDDPFLNFPRPEWQRLGYGAYGMLAEEGLHPNVAAELFGFSSGDAMIRALLAAPKAEEVIAQEVDQRMLERYGDLATPEAMERAAQAAVHNDARIRFLHIELQALAKATGSRTVLAAAAKANAQDVIARRKVRDLRPDTYRKAEVRYAKEATRAHRDGDLRLAAEKKRAELLNAYLFREASRARDEAEKIVRRLAKYNGKMASLDVGYLDQIRGLLARFDLRRGVSLKELDRRQNLVDWVAKEKEAGREPVIDEFLLQEANRTHYQNLTMEELRGLNDSIESIAHAGRLKKKLLTAKDQRELAARVEEATASLAEHAGRKVTPQPTPNDAVGKLGHWWRSASAGLRKFSSLLREMDGLRDGGVMWELFGRPMNEAGDEETERNAADAEAMDALFEPVRGLQRRPGQSVYATRQAIPGTRLSLTDEQRHMIALNWGNEGNRQRLLDGGLAGRARLTEEEVQAVLDTLTEAEWGFVQGIWDYLDTKRPAIAKLERAITGREPTWIEPTSIQTRVGVIRGGYFPAKYDTLLSTQSASLEAATTLRQGMKGAFVSASARDGYTKERAAQVKNRPLLLSYGVIAAHLQEVNHRLAWQPWLVDANRLLKRLDGPIREFYGAEVYEELRDHIKAIAEGDEGARNAFQKAVNHIRTGATIVGLGWRFTTALIQPIGLTQSWARIGGPWVARGLQSYLAHPVETTREVEAKSRAMRDRGRTLQREVNEILNRVRKGGKITTLQASYFTLIQQLQRTVDVPTWLGAYEKALASDHYEVAVDAAERSAIEKRAIALADQAVIDSQSGGQIKDLARVQRGSPAWKLFTNFYSYFSATYNLNVEAFKRADLKQPKDVATLAADLLILNFIPVVFSVALRNLLKGNCDWDDWGCLGKRLASEQIGYLFSQIVLLREATDSATALFGLDSYDYEGPAGLRLFSSSIQAAKQIAQGEVDIQAFKAVNEVGGVLLHYPAGQINQSLEGILAIANGDVEGTAILPALLAGPPKD